MFKNKRLMDCFNFLFGFFIMKIAMLLLVKTKLFYSKWLRFKKGKILNLKKIRVKITE